VRRRLNHSEESRSESLCNRMLLRGDIRNGVRVHYNFVGQIGEQCGKCLRK
jgi:hypothetical protein